MNQSNLRSLSNSLVEFFFLAVLWPRQDLEESIKRGKEVYAIKLSELSHGRWERNTGDQPSAGRC